MPPSEKEFRWRVDALLNKHAIPREDAEEIVAAKIGRPQLSVEPRVVQQVYQRPTGTPARPREMPLMIGNAPVVSVRVSA